MARLVGNTLAIQFKGVLMSGDYRSFEAAHEQEQADVSAGADTYRTFAPTLKTLGATASVLWQDKASATAVYAQLVVGAEGSLVWSPEGTAVGKPRWGMTARLTKVDQSYPFDDAVEYSLEWVNSGTALIYDGATAVWA